MNARGDMRKRNSRGERERGPVISRLVATVCHQSQLPIRDLEIGEGYCIYLYRSQDYSKQSKQESSNREVIISIRS
jgi:hypothetical protein